MRFPDQNFSVIVFANRGDADTNQLAFQVADIFLESDYKIVSPVIKDVKAPEIVSPRLKPSELEAVSGYYWNDQYTYSRRVYVKDNKLRYLRSDGRETELTPIAHNKFKMVDVPYDGQISFELLNDEIKMTVIVNEGKPITSFSYDPIRYNRSEITQFVGSYFSKELGTVYDIKLENDELKLYINSKKIIWFFTPIMKNFLINELVGTFKFEQNASGHITGFNLSSGRVKDLKFERI